MASPSGLYYGDVLAAIALYITLSRALYRASGVSFNEIYLIGGLIGPGRSGLEMA